MKLVALGFKISAVGHKIIEDIAKNIFKQDAEIIDVMTSKVNLQPTDWVLCFGPHAQRQINDRIDNTLFLPKLTLLEPNKNNDSHRQKTYEQLLAFKEYVKSQKTVTIADLPVLSCEKVQSIESSLKSRNCNSWKGRTRDGKSIEIQLVPQQSNADVVLTFTELYAIKTAVDILDIDELVIS